MQQANTRRVLQYLPNSLTLLRLLLALPLGAAILRSDYSLALAIGLLAGVSDALDGYSARRLQAFSKFGAALDPIADKTLITVCFVCFAQTGLVDWYLALLVIGRDAVIVCGAIAYRLLYGPFEFAATALSKGNMFVQICFCLVLLLAQVMVSIPPWMVPATTVAVVLLAIASGSDYVVRWSLRARHAHNSRH